MADIRELRQAREAGREAGAAAAEELGGGPAIRTMWRPVGELIDPGSWKDERLKQIIGGAEGYGNLVAGDSGSALTSTLEWTQRLVAAMPDLYHSGPTLFKKALDIATRNAALLAKAGLPQAVALLRVIEPYLPLPEVKVAGRGGAVRRATAAALEEATAQVLAPRAAPRAGGGGGGSGGSGKPRAQITGGGPDTGAAQTAVNQGVAGFNQAVGAAQGQVSGAAGRFGEQVAAMGEQVEGSGQSAIAGFGERAGAIGETLTAAAANALGGIGSVAPQLAGAGVRGAVSAAPRLAGAAPRARPEGGGGGGGGSAPRRKEGSGGGGGAKGEKGEREGRGYLRDLPIILGMGALAAGRGLGTLAFAGGVAGIKYSPVAARMAARGVTNVASSVKQGVVERSAEFKEQLLEEYLRLGGELQAQLASGGEAPVDLQDFRANVHRFREIGERLGIYSPGHDLPQEQMDWMVSALGLSQQHALPNQARYATTLQQALGLDDQSLAAAGARRKTVAAEAVGAQPEADPMQEYLAATEWLRERIGTAAEGTQEWRFMIQRQQELAQRAGIPPFPAEATPAATPVKEEPQAEAKTPVEAAGVSRPQPAPTQEAEGGLFQDYLRVTERLMELNETGGQFGPEWYRLLEEQAELTAQIGISSAPQPRTAETGETTPPPQAPEEARPAGPTIEDLKRLLAAAITAGQKRKGEPSRPEPQEAVPEGAEMPVRPYDPVADFLEASQGELSSATLEAIAGRVVEEMRALTERFKAGEEISDEERRRVPLLRRALGQARYHARYSFSENEELRHRLVEARRDLNQLAAQVRISTARGRRAEPSQSRAREDGSHETLVFPAPGDSDPRVIEGEFRVREAEDEEEAPGTQVGETAVDEEGKPIPGANDPKAGGAQVAPGTLETPPET